MADQDTTFRLLVDELAGRAALKAFGADATKVLGIERELAAAGKTIGTVVAGGMATATPPVVKLGRETDVVAGKARGVGGRFVAAGDDVERAMGSASRSVGAFGRVAEVALGMSLGQVGAQAINRVREGVVALAGAGVTFEQQMADLSAITGIAGSDLDALGDAARAAAVETGVGAAEQAEAFKLLASNIDIASMGGVAGLQAMGREVVTLATAAGTDLATAADTVAGTLNQFKLGGEEAARVVNVLAAGAQKGAAELPDLSESLRVAGTAAASAGLDVEETVGALEILGQNAQKGATAGTGFAAVLGVLQTQSKKLAELGFAGVNLEGEGLQRTLERLAPLAADATARAALFGSEHQDLAQILISSAGAVETMTASVTGTNTAQEQAEIQMSTLRGSVTLLKTALEELAVNGYDGLGGAARNLVLGLTSTVRWLDENWESVETVTKAMAVAVIAYGSYQAAALISAAATVGLTGVVAAATTAFWTFTAAIAANPLGALITVLGAAVGAWVLFGDAAERAAARTETAMDRAAAAADRTRAAILNMNEAEALAARARATADARDQNAPIRANAAAQTALRDEIDAVMQGDPRQRGRASGLRVELTELRRAGAVLLQLQNEYLEIRNSAGERLEALAAIPDAPTPPAAVVPSAAAATRPAAAGGETPKQRADRLKREAEEARQAALALAEAQREVNVRSVLGLEEAARHRRALRVQDLRETHADNAERIALMTDEHARRRAELSNDSNLAEATRQVEIEGIRATATAAETAAQAARDSAIARIDGERAATERNADETARVQLAEEEFVLARDLARNRRDEEVEASDQDARVRTQRDAAEARKIEDDALGRTLANLHTEQEAREQALDDEARARERAEREREEAHRRQMDRLQEQADAVLAAVGLASAVSVAAAARRRADLDAEHADETHRREAAQDAELARLQARVDAERGVVDERTAAERAFDSEKTRIDAARSAADLTYRRRAAQMDRTAAIAEKRARLFEIAIQTALNVVKAFPNPVKMALAGALGVSQGVAVAGQPLPAIPQYALGTDRARGGLALVGERGPEIVNIPGGSSVITNDRTERLGAAMRAVERATAGSAGLGSQIVVQQTADPAHAAAFDALRRETARQTARIEAGLSGVESAVRAQGGRLDYLELSRGIRTVEAREDAAGNTRKR